MPDIDEAKKRYASLIEIVVTHAGSLEASVESHGRSAILAETAA
ncbi:hypothetical protein [Arenibaculum pallidiluteum]|nr:hypothetical protein [Arenibaculum pallidiluteum]